MKDHEINAEIAKYCGWTEHNGWWYARDNYEESSPPDYVFDLNAMHEAERALTPPWRSIYQGHLDKVCHTSRYNHCSAWHLLHATASQRAEAFLKTLGKWKDE